jgi:hypothetical protein
MHGADMDNGLVLVSRPENKFKNIETLKVIARSRRRRSNLLQASENSNFHEMGLLRFARNDLLWGLIYTKNFWDTTLVWGFIS